MKIIDAITAIDKVKPNQYTQEEKIRWLSEIDGHIKNEIIDTHEGSEDVAFVGYDENTDTGTELLAPAPHDELYIHWLESKIDYANGEETKYNNSTTAFNTSIATFERYYNRTHTPKGQKLKLF